MTENNKTNTQKLLIQRMLILCGIVGPVLFTILVIVESIIRPGYSQVGNYISDLGIGSYAIIQNVNFIIFGLLTIGFAAGVAVSLPNNVDYKIKKWINRSIILFGIAIILAGLSLTVIMVNQQLFMAAVMAHNLTSFIGFFSIIAAQLLTWKALIGSDNKIWKNYRMYTLLSGLFAIAALILFVSTMFSPYKGATERIFTCICLLWMAVTALKLSVQRLDNPIKHR
jgi:hypothetical membrane protein